jgi:hypothetical protein
LKLTVEGQTRTATVDVLPDPRFKPADELAEQVKFALQIRDDVSKLAGIVNRLRAVAKQLKDRNDLLKGDESAEPLVKASTEFLKKLDALEEKLHNPKAKVPYDILAQKGGAQLYSQLAWLYELLKDSDGTPGQGLREVYADQAELLKKYEVEWQDLTKKDLAALNEQATKLGIPGVFVPKVIPTGKGTPASGDLPEEARRLLDDIDLPPVSIGPYRAAPPPEPAPKFDPRILQQYTRLALTDVSREPVARARAVMAEVAKQPALRDHFPRVANENRFKQELLEVQRAVAGLQLRLTEAVEELDRCGKQPGSANEREQAAVLYCRAVLRLQIALLYEYQSGLGQMRREFPPFDPQTHTGWRLVGAVAMHGDAEGKKSARVAQKELDLLIQTHAGTPHAWLARNQRDARLGLEWRAVTEEK